MDRSFEWWFRTGLRCSLYPHLASRRVWYNMRRCASDRISSFGYYNYPYHIIFLAGMAMSATTWMKNLLARIPGYYMRATPMPKEVAYNQNICDSAFNHVPRRGYALFKTHLQPDPQNIECIFRNGVEKVLITYRDLRDIAVARYYRLIDAPKSKDAHDFIDYRALGKEKALDHSIEHVADFYVYWIRGWFKIANEVPERYHFTKFEDLKNDTEGEFRKVLHFYGIELPDKKIGQIVEAAKGRKTMRKNLNAARILPFAYSSNFRSGKTGNWKTEFSDAQIEKCKKLLGPTLIELGYEKDLDW